MSFTYDEKNGLQLYLDGELTFKTNKPAKLSRDDVSKRLRKDDNYGMVIGHGTGGKFGRFKIAHLALWRKALEPKKMMEAYAEKVDTTIKDFNVPCYQQKGLYSFLCEEPKNNQASSVFLRGLVSLRSCCS